MRTEYSDSLIYFTGILLVACTLSCSGLPGKNPGKVISSVSVSDPDIAAKHIKMISPEENTGYSNSCIGRYKQNT
jgi:hypothetical protein